MDEHYPEVGDLWRRRSDDAHVIVVQVDATGTRLTYWSGRRRTRKLVRAFRREFRFMRHESPFERKLREDTE